MTSDEHVFGSGELTPDLLREATFSEEDGRCDAAAVRAFLDRAASALEVLMAEDASIALRAEFSRNAEIAQQVLDAGQTAAAQLREQAEAEAERMLTQAHDTAASLREAAEHEVGTTRDEAAELLTSAESARAHLVQDMRDLYDRVGASLYRFERADDARADRAAFDEGVLQGRSDANDVADRRGAEEPVPSPIDFRQERRAEEPPQEQEVAGTEEVVDLPEGTMPPAWQQLDPELLEPAAAVDTAVEADPPLPPKGPRPVPGAATEPEAAPEASAEPVADAEPARPVQAVTDPFLVVEDEPLAPGEPLVDLRETQAPAGGGEASSWLEEPAAEPVAMPESDAATLHDNMLAEALIAGSPFAEDGDQGDAPAEPEPFAAPTVSGLEVPPEIFAAPAVSALEVTEPAADPSVDGASSAQPASPDANAVRDLILNSLADGHPREAVEAYLRDQLGMVEPGILVDAALGTAQPPA